VGGTGEPPLDPDIARPAQRAGEQPGEELILPFRQADADLPAAAAIELGRAPSTGPLPARETSVRHLEESGLGQAIEMKGG
jgi:hypothetical protein